ncbi:MAG: ATP-binding protein, partial [Candidatus Aenigmatarchaeota archaeon]
AGKATDGPEGQAKMVTVANTRVIGYRNPRGFLVVPSSPFSPGTGVFPATDDQIKSALGLPNEGLYIGLLDRYNIKVNLPVKHLISKHVAILAKTGAGKSYMAGVILEEFAEKDIPIVVLDPHGEYSSLARENDEAKELKFMEKFDIKPKSYASQLRRFCIEDGSLRLTSRLTAEELFECLPVKASGTQKGLIYSAMRNLGGKDYTLKDMINEISTLPSQSKWNLISALEFLDNTKLFSKNPTLPTELVKTGQISIVDMKFARPEIQHTIAYKITEELFNARKAGTIPGFFLVLEEAHTFCPERGFGEVPSSRVIRTIASEGRKFGLSLCVITQRPARIDKNVLSQCNTQVIMKVTNPNDLKAITDSAEGITPGMREEIRDLPVGSAIVVGVAEHPILAEIRVRRSKHGGEAPIVQQKPATTTVRNVAFQPKISLEDAEAQFKGVDSFTQIHYPVWRVKGTDQKGGIVEVHVDGLLGEIMYGSDTGMLRTAGINSLATLSSVERQIIATLSSTQGATLDKISSAVRLMSHDTQRMLKLLMSKGLVASDGYMFRPAKIKLPGDILKRGIQADATEADLGGKIISFTVPKETAEKIASLFGVSAESSQVIYYPYWLLVYSNKKALVDGLTMKVDVTATKEVIGMIK